MQRALRLARRGVGRTSPNPMVGAVVVRKGKIVGEGYHLYHKREHAEVVALRQAGAQARGADLYVTLEPCVHQGRTPPCVDRVIASGVKRVCVAVRDPNPVVSGKGIQVLTGAGLEVAEGICQRQAARLNESFFHFIQNGRPFVLLKLALSLDGKIATRCGDSQWITGPAARRAGHRLRYQHDAILVGVGTVLEDDPQLNVRWRRGNRITKVVLDSRLRTPPQAKLFESPDPVVIFHGPEAPRSSVKDLSSKGTLVPVSEKHGQLDWVGVLDELGRMAITSLMIEGGAAVATSALRARIVHKVNLFYGPLMVGGDGKNAVRELGVDDLKDALRLQGTSSRKLDSDLMLEAYLDT